MKRPQEAFEPTARHYFVSPLVPDSAPAGPVVAAAREGLFPAGFRNAAVDPHSAYAGLSSWESRRVREARARAYVGTQWSSLAARELLLAGGGL